jgi:hypothetical protein
MSCMANARSYFSGVFRFDHHNLHTFPLRGIVDVPLRTDMVQAGRTQGVH